MLLNKLKATNGQGWIQTLTCESYYSFYLFTYVINCIRIVFVSNVSNIANVTFRAICEKLAKAYKIQDSNLYICIGGKPATWGAGAGGVSMKGTVCDKSVVMRSAYIQYVTQAADTGMDLKADQMAGYTSAVRITKMNLKKEKG